MSSPWLLVLLGVVMLSVNLCCNGAHALSAEQKRCAEARATFTNCRVSREQATSCLFQYFAPRETPDEIPVQVLRDAWVKLLNDAQRNIAGSVENIIDACNPTHAASFSRQAMLDNECHCMENCSWTSRIQVVCNMAKNNPNWRERA